MIARAFSVVCRIAIASAIALLGLVSVAGAAFLASGSGYGSATAGTLSPSTLTATPESPSAGQVALHWTAVAAAGDQVKYYVTRVGGTVGGDCPSSAATAATNLSCTDKGLAAGTYNYTVTAVVKSWTSTSAEASATLTYGPLAQLQLSGPDATSAGVGFSITVTAQDADGNTVADYTGNHSLTFSGASVAPDGAQPTVTDASGTAQTFGTAESISFSGGVASDGSSADVMALYKSETANVTVTDGTVSSNTLPVTVSAGAAGELVFNTAPVSGTASASASLGPITVQEQDRFGNPTTTAETVGLSSSSPGTYIFNTTQGVTAPTGSTTVNIPSGSSSATFYYGDTHADGPSITAAATGLLSATQTETINPAAANKLVYKTGAVTGIASASASLGPITVQEQDQFGNPTTSAETVSLSSGSPGTYIFNTTQGASSPTGNTTVSIPSGSSSATFYYGDTHADGPTITAAASGLLSATQTETINPAAASKLVYKTGPVTGTASASANVGPITVQEQDQFGNPTTTAETVSLSSSSPGTYIFSTTQGATSPTGSRSLSIPGGSSSVTFYYGDTHADGPTITAAATGLTSATQTETINPAAAKQLVFTTPAVSGPASSSASVGPITVQEQDQFGNLTTSPETINLSSSSPGATVFNTTRGATANGTVSIPGGSSSVTFYYGDTHADGPTITAAATGLTSATQTETITAAAAKQLVFTTPAVSGLASSTASLGPITVQEQDAFGNLTTSAETINLSSSSPGTYIFNTTQGATSPTGNSSVSIPSGSSSVTFYYGDTHADGPTITAAATGLTSATQTETITAPVTATSVAEATGPSTSLVTPNSIAPVNGSTYVIFVYCSGQSASCAGSSAEASVTSPAFSSVTFEKSIGTGTSKDCLQLFTAIGSGTSGKVTVSAGQSDQQIGFVNVVQLSPGATVQNGGPNLPTATGSTTPATAAALSSPNPAFGELVPVGVSDGGGAISISTPSGWSLLGSTQSGASNAGMAVFFNPSDENGASFSSTLSPASPTNGWATYSIEVG